MALCREEIFGVSFTLRLLRFLHSSDSFGRNMYNPSITLPQFDPPFYSVRRDCGCGYTFHGPPFVRNYPKEKKTETYWNLAHNHAQHLYLLGPSLPSTLSITIFAPSMRSSSNVSPLAPSYVMNQLKAWWIIYSLMHDIAYVFKNTKRLHLTSLGGVFFLLDGQTRRV